MTHSFWNHRGMSRSVVVKIKISVTNFSHELNAARHGYKESPSISSHLHSHRHSAEIILEDNFKEEDLRIFNLICFCGILLFIFLVIYGLQFTWAVYSQLFIPSTKPLKTGLAYCMTRSWTIVTSVLDKINRSLVDYRSHLVFLGAVNFLIVIYLVAHHICILEVKQKRLPLFWWIYNHICIIPRCPPSLNRSSRLRFI